MVAVITALGPWLVLSPSSIGFRSRGVTGSEVVGGVVLLGVSVLLGLPAVRYRFWSFPALCLLTLVLVGCNPEQYPQTTLLPRGDFASIAHDILDTTFKWALVVFVLVEGALIYAIFRFRGKADDPEPQQTHGNTVVEIIWTVIPAALLAAIAVPTVKAIFQTNAAPAQDALTVEVVGHQWWWEFHYPEYNLTTANELHIPIGRTVLLRMGSADVVHSFWVPQLAGKRDLFPNRETRMWFRAEKAGEYRGQCAEFCGIQHARMAYWIVAQKPEAFQAWLTHMQSLTGDPLATSTTGSPDSVMGRRRLSSQNPGPPRTADSGSRPQVPGDTLYAPGEKLFEMKGCAGCHSLTAVNATIGMAGPNLSNIGARSYIAAGMLENTNGNLARWIRDPQAIKQGVRMPNLGVTEQEARALAAFLRAQR